MRLLLRSYLSLDDLLAAAKRGFDVRSLRDLDEAGWAAMAQWVRAHIKLAAHAAQHNVEIGDLAALVSERFDLRNLADLSGKQHKDLWEIIEHERKPDDQESP